MDDKADSLGSESIASTASDAGKVVRQIDHLDSFKSFGGTGGIVSGRGTASSGKTGKPKKKIGRPTKNLAGFSAEKIDEVADDPELEAARVEFEEVLVELLVATTDNLADSRFLLLKQRFPEAEARGLADKFRLTDSEKKYFGGVAIRLWRKYLGDKYLFTDESIAAVYALKYCMRNFEGFSQSNKVLQEMKNAKQPPYQKQPGLQSAPRPGPGSEQDRQINANGSADLHSPR
jgi:hypothetical protein